MLYEFLIALLVETCRAFLVETLTSHVYKFADRVRLNMRRKKDKASVAVRTHRRVRQQLIHRMQTNKRTEM